MIWQGLPATKVTIQQEVAMYRQILIPTDGSELANKAVTHGIGLAKAVGAKVTVITVEQPFNVFDVPASRTNRMPEAFAQHAKQIKEHASKVLSEAAEAAKQTGAPIVGAPITAETAKKLGVPEKQIVIARGGDSLKFGDATIEVALAQHSTVQDGLQAIYAQLYANGNFTLATKFNVGDARLTGVEFNYSQVVSAAFLPAWANDRFTVNNGDANVKATNTSVDNSLKLARFTNNWVAQLAANYGLGLSNIVEAESSRSNRIGAKLSNITTSSHSSTVAITGLL